ncbi:MAG: tetratricopeptide repeat protein [Myxococcales bacterium]|nr:tetratricopeptide repeat protein [Myxococcales bacterium]
MAVSQERARKHDMEMDVLCGELERLFSFEEMGELSRVVLGLSPEDVGGGTATASFARALVERCRVEESLDALVDAIVALRTEVDPRVRDATIHGFPLVDELGTGSQLGPFTITKKIGEGPLAHTYHAHRNGSEVVLRVLRSEVAFDLRRVRRYATHVRLIHRLKHPGLPSGGFVEQVEGRIVMGYSFFEAQSLAARLGRSGPLHINEARPILKGILEVLALLHEKRLVHGNLKLENVLLERSPDGATRVYVVDAGADRLRRRARAAGDVLGMVVTPKIAAPELHRGKVADPRSDVYAFGILLYEVLTGKAPFLSTSPVEAALLHLNKEPEPPSLVAPRGWITKDLDGFLLSLLKKEPTDRPKDGRALLEAVEMLGRTSAQRSTPKMSEEQLTELIDGLVAAPEDEEAALKLESAVEEGADGRKVAEAFAMAADQIEGEGADKVESKKSLLFRAARLYESSLKDLEKAEYVYGQIVAIDPGDDIAQVALEDLRRQLGKYEELVEMLVARSEQVTGVDRARAMAEIGRLYAHELDDKEQAVVAYAHALSNDPTHGELALELERLAGTDLALWNEVLTVLSQAVQGEITPESRNALMLRLGGWYGAKISRPDLALACFQSVVAAEPSNDAALEGMANIYRTAQQWPELGTVLLRRADVAPNPTRARDFRAKAAEILDTKLNEPLRAKDIYEQILAEDPTHEASIEALAKIYERTGDNQNLVRMLDKQAEALRGEERARVLCRIAELYEGQLDDLTEAIKRFEAALAVNDRYLDALKGLDRIFNRTGRYKDLLANLERQLHIAATPRQKINLLERIAAIHDEEFLDHRAASAAYEQILQIDGAHENSLTALVRHYRALDRWEDVAALYERHLKIAEGQRRIELLLARGRVLADQVGSPERAMAAYEAVLEQQPDHSGALEALARLREKSGDAMAALGAIEALAAKATTPEAKAEQWLRAAKLLEARGDRDGAIERYKAALDADPKNAAATAALRAAYAARGDAASAVELIAREIESAEGNLSKARLYGEMARLLRDRVKDDSRAAEAARKAVDLDPTAIDGLLVLGDLAFEQGRPLEASRHFESLVARTDVLPKADAVRVLVRYIDALSKTGSTEKALMSVDTLRKLAPDDGEVIGRVARVLFEHGEARHAFEVNLEFFERFGELLHGTERAEALYRLGELGRKLGDLDRAIAWLQEAAECDPSLAAPVEALSQVYGDKGDWEEVIRIKHRRLDVVSDSARSELLIEIGEILATKIGDRTRAAKSYVAALEDRPDDRKLLMKLMQLYSEDKDWTKLVEIVLRFADFADEAKIKAKYIHTAANICHRQLGDLDAALNYYTQVLALDPTTPKALQDATDLRREKGDWAGVEQLLRMQLENTPPHESDKMVALLDQLGEVYHKHLGDIDQAIEAYEAAQDLDPDNRERNERLADMYASDPSKYLEKAVAAQRSILQRNPHKPEGYKLLRRLYTETKRADCAWCLCQALYILNLAEPDEERFFKRMRADGPAPAQDRLSDEDWALRIRHHDADPLVTALFALIEPAILTRSQPLEAMGYDPRYAVDLSLHPYAMSQTLYYASGVLGMIPPPTFQNPNDPGGLSFVHAQTPALVLGHAALAADAPPQAMAFLAARQLAYFRPGFYTRYLVPTNTGLKSWLFAAIKLIAPQFPVSPDIEGPVKDNMDLLSKHFHGPARDHLASLVTKMLQGGGSLDLRRWVSAIDLSADRAGFLLAHDLEVAAELIKAREEPTLPARERLKELVLFSVSEEYFHLRRKLGIAIDS